MVSAQYFNQHSNLATDDYVGRIVLRPNNSMSWRATRYFLASLMVLSFSMALFFALQGYWVILFFTALEMSVLSGCMYYLYKRNRIQEVLLFGPTEVVIEIGREYPEERHKWQRFFTKILVEGPKHPWYPSKIALRCKQEEREIGKFLSPQDKKALVRELRQMVIAADTRQQQYG